MQKFGVKTIVAIGIGAAIFFLLARFVSIPVPGVPNTSISFQYAVLGFFAAVFGPIAGLLIGLIGHALTDLTWGGLWWTWIGSSALVGLLCGFLLKGINIEAGELGKKGILRYTIGSFLVNIVVWTAIPSTLDMLIYAEPASKVYLQGITAGISNGIITAVIGGILLFAYSKTRTKTGSLNKE